MRVTATGRQASSAVMRFNVRGFSFCFTPPPACDMAAIDGYYVAVPNLKAADIEKNDRATAWLKSIFSSGGFSEA
jgi:hypothetical protein